MNARFSLAALSTLLVLSACDSSADLASANAESRAGKTGLEIPSRESVLAAVDPNTYDHYLVQISLRVPGFAGLYEENGDLRVAVARSAADPSAVVSASLSAADALLPAGSESRSHKAVLAPVAARYEFSEVMYWRTLVTMDAPGLVFDDADERRGIVVVGVKTEADVKAMRERAQELGIPEDALDVSVSPAINGLMGWPNINIQDAEPYLEGGYGISMPIGLGGSSCTLGFMAFRGSSPGDIGGFVTNSHCTRADKQVGGVNNVAFYQGASSSSIGNQSRYLGLEVVDPDFYTVGFAPTGGTTGFGPPVGGGSKPYRYSDAAFVDFELPSSNTTNVFFGRIVKTNGYGTSSAGSRIRTSSYEITANAASYQHPMGSTVNRVGAASGWTQGPVTRSCVSVQDENTDVLSYDSELRCQYFFQAFSADGDSGSPVYVDTGAGTARLQGLAWGGTDTLPKEVVYSPFNGVDLDLKRSGTNGNLYTYGPTSTFATSASM